MPGIPEQEGIEETFHHTEEGTEGRELQHCLEFFWKHSQNSERITG